ncbi:hypothetical protein ACFLRX_01985 [Acidobacteriota bacterium]
MYDQIKFFRRRQFVLGPKHLNYKGWNKLIIDDKHLLTIHPDLTVSIVEKQGIKAILLGYAIDPYHTKLEDEDILKNLISGQLSLYDIILKLNSLSGRFVLIIKSSEGLWLFPDACALRQVNYCKDMQGAVWCASQAETLSEYFGFEYDEEVLSYRNLPRYRSSKDEFWMLNDRTPYREIRYLLANHYLDLLTGEVYRFRPTAGSINPLSAGRSIQLSTPILQNSIKTAVQRFDLKMGISAGSDSRRTLAASKDVKDQIYFFTHTPRSFNNADNIIPARLLPKFGIKHHQFEMQLMSSEFRKYYECSATWARERRGHIAHTAYLNFGPETTVLNSNLSEISQCWYWLPKSKINGEGLALASRLYHPFAIKEFQNWIEGARSSCELANMNILTLFDIELRSRWVAAAFAEYDIAYDTFCPYNNFYFLSLEISVNERHRRRRLDVLIKHIKYMWPELLNEPINPPDRTIEKIQQFIWKKVIHKTITPLFPIYDYLRYIKLRRLFKHQTQNLEIQEN